jgi:hypothetical protein
MANRDYFNRLIQGNGRDSYDYGNTNLKGHGETGPLLWSRWFAYAVMAMVGGLVVFNVIRYFS